jgi:D-3-phosphoglycerate dehydrogenase
MIRSNQNVLVTTRFFDEDAAAFLRSHGYGVVTPDLPPGASDSDLPPEEVLRLLDGVQGWIVGTASVTRALLTARPDVRIISRRGVGFERIDVTAAQELGRVVTIAAGGNQDSVADHAVGLMLGVGKQLNAMAERMRKGGDWSVGTTLELYGKTVGIIGLGRIGRVLARRLSGFDVTVLAYDIAPDTAYAAQHGVRLVDLPTLLALSDYVSVHVPFGPDTQNLIGAAELAAMRPGGVLINTARGGVVDEAAVLAALQSGHLAGFGADVFLAEHRPEARPVMEALLALPNVMGTPHAAAATQGGLRRANMIAAENVVAVLGGGDPRPDCIIADGRR